MFSIVAILCVTIPCAMSQGWGKPEVGICPELPQLDSFDMSRFYGRFYDIAHNHWLFGEPNIACVTADYTKIDGVDIHVTQSDEVRILGTATNMQVKGIAQHTAIPGQFTFYVPEVENPPDDGTSNYNFIATDYDNYVCLYECMQIEPELMEVMAFALHRDRHGENMCKEAFDALGVKVEEMVYTTHDDDCTYFPEP